MRNITIAIAFALAGQLFAGGFWLQLGNPDANPEAKQRNAVITIKATGCHDPAVAKVTATAVGLVDGERRTIPLKLEKLSEPGSYVLSRQWPAQGKWVIQLIGRNDEQFTNTILAAGPQGVDRLHAHAAMKEFTPAEIDALLK